MGMRGMAFAVAYATRASALGFAVVMAFSGARPDFFSARFKRLSILAAIIFAGALIAR